jgi:hypothetical protein
MLGPSDVRSEMDRARRDEMLAHAARERTSLLTEMLRRRRERRATRRARLLSLAWPSVAIEFTEWATEILRRSYSSARRFNPHVSLRLRRVGSGVEFALTEDRDPADDVVSGDGFELRVERGLEGIVDVVEPHDQLILRPPGSTERSVRA